MDYPAILGRLYLLAWLACVALGGGAVVTATIVAIVQMSATQPHERPPPPGTVPYDPWLKDPIVQPLNPLVLTPEQKRGIERADWKMTVTVGSILSALSWLPFGLLWLIRWIVSGRRSLGWRV